MTTIKSGSSAQEIRNMIEAGTASKQDAIAYIKAHLAEKQAKGKVARFPMRKLYEELTGTHVKGVRELASAAKSEAPAKAKPAKQAAKGDLDVAAYTAKAAAMTDNSLNFALKRTKDAAKLAVLNAEFASRQGEQAAPAKAKPAKQGGLRDQLAEAGFDTDALDSMSASELLIALDAIMRK